MPDLRALRLVALRLTPWTSPGGSARRCVGALVVAWLLAWLLTGSAARACEVRKRTTVPVRLENGLAVVDVGVDAAVVPMILDTGADVTALTEAAVARLNVPLDEWTSNTMRGAGGRLEAHRNARPATLQLGGVALRRRAVSARASVAVIAGDGSSGQGGLLGDDLLSLFDLDVDLPARTLTLYEVRDRGTNAEHVCAGRFIPWDAAFDVVPIELGMRSRAVPLVPARLDGHAVIALLDTGASSSFVNLRGMRRTGVTPLALEADPLRVMGTIGGLTQGRLHRFTELRIGATVLSAPTLVTAPVPTEVFDMLLGLDVWLTRRLWISYATKQIFVARPPA